MLILTASKIYTLNPQQPIVEALAIKTFEVLETSNVLRGVVIAAGDAEALRREFPRARREHLEDAVILPGLTDAHIHLHHYAISLKKIDCEVATRSECLQRVAERARAAAPGEWIQGHGWDQNRWPEGFGRAADLDAVAPHNPVYLTAKSLHAAWANTAALRAAGINSNTPDPEDGEIQRDAHGEPTGILLEGAMRLVDAVIPQPEGEALAALISAAQEHLLRLGLTGVHDFDRRACFDALQRLHQRGELRLRVVKNIPVEDLPYAVGLGLRQGFGDDWLRVGGVKAFVDGALGPHTAAMLEPYEDDPSNRGMLLLDAEQIVEFGRDAIANGLPLTIHAIGDRANHEVLDAFERLRAFERRMQTADGGLQTASGQRSSVFRQLRHRIEHVQLTHPEDAPRLAALGVIASMQPIHATSDMDMAGRYWGERSRHAYAWRTQLDHGAVLAFGSDAPVESPNPFWGIHAAVTRRRGDGSPGPEGWYPEQRLSVEETLHAYTFGPAYAAGMEDRLGMLAPGYYADLIVMDTDPFRCEPEQLRDLQPTRVMINGVWVIGD